MTGLDGRSAHSEIVSDPRAILTEDARDLLVTGELVAVGSAQSVLDVARQIVTRSSYCVTV
jgi:hypothetical protein